MGSVTTKRKKIDKFEDGEGGDLVAGVDVDIKGPGVVAEEDEVVEGRRFWICLWCCGFGEEGGELEKDLDAYSSCVN